MPPERASGKSVDKRAYIWSFEAVLYEMLVGKKAYDGESVSDALALSFCFDVQLKTLRTKAYVMVSWGIFHADQMISNREHVTKVRRPILVFHFDCPFMPAGIFRDGSLWIRLRPR